jgi:DNA-directed RNA polymerase subunit RPC12/RpoP
VDDQKLYVCARCKKEIVVLVDVPPGNCRDYEEECPACRQLNKIHVEIDGNGRPWVWAFANKRQSNAPP